MISMEMDLEQVEPQIPHSEFLSVAVDSKYQAVGCPNSAISSNKRKTKQSKKKKKKTNSNREKENNEIRNMKKSNIYNMGRTLQ